METSLISAAVFLARLSGERVFAVSAPDQVVAVASQHEVVAGSAHQTVVAFRAQQSVGTPGVPQNNHIGGHGIGSLFMQILLADDDQPACRFPKSSG